MDKPWFAVRRFGWGAGWPIVWQGWAVYAVGAALGLLILFYPPRPLNFWLFGGLILALNVLAIAKTKGGVRWRWGRRD